MINGLKLYSAMKDSGVPWLGEVPEHWEVAPAFAVYRPRQVKNTGLVESTVLSLSYGQIIIKAPEKLRGLVPESFETYQIVEPGNIIVRTTDLQNDQTSLRIGHAHHRGIITAAYMALETKPIVLNEFGYQYLNAYDLLKIIYGFGSGLRQNLDFSDIKRMPVLVPPRDEQAAIVRFLEHADRKIRRYIRAKQKLIKLLEEQKQVIIHRTVTRGLDPSVPLKPSGISWLGDIPEHWEVKPLKHFVPQVTVGIVVQPASLYVSEGIPCLRSLNISSGCIEPSPIVYISPESNTQHRKSMLRVGDVVVVRTGRAGVAVVVPPELDGSNCIDLLIVRRSIAIESAFLATYLNSWAAKTDIQFRSVGAIQAHYNTTALANMIIAMPPRDEQVRLLEHLDDEVSSVVTSQQRVGRELDLLHEYRTRLIADVVTGKLDVREAAAKLHDEVNDPDDLDLCMAVDEDNVDIQDDTEAELDDA
jgi:type I restriction enzyme S subunit